MEVSIAYLDVGFKLVGTATRIESKRMNTFRETNRSIGLSILYKKHKSKRIATILKCLCDL